MNILNHTIFKKRFFSFFLTISIITVTLIQCTPVDIICSRDGGPWLRFTPKLIEAPVSVIEITLLQGNYPILEETCNYVTCNIINVFYKVYEVTGNEEDLLLDEGEIVYDRDTHLIIMQNLPASANIRLVIETVIDEECRLARNLDDSFLYTFEYTFATPDYPVGVNTLPQQLSYNPNSTTYVANSGNIYTAIPTILPNNIDHTYSFISSYEGDLTFEDRYFQIDQNTGQFIINPGNIGDRSLGIYTLDVIVSNMYGNNYFNNAYTVDIVEVNNTGAPPSNLVYNPITILQATSNNPSRLPTIQGDSPFTFSLVNPPVPENAISINSESGRITAYPALAEEYGDGTYVLNVEVSNPVGTVIFNNAMSFNVMISTNGNPPSNLVYDPNTVTITTATQTEQVLPSINGTAPFTYSLLSIEPAATGVTINPNTGLLTVTPSLATEFGNGTYNINVGVSNAFGNTTFNNAFTVVVDVP